MFMQDDMTAPTEEKKDETQDASTGAPADENTGASTDANPTEAPAETPQQ